MRSKRAASRDASQKETASGDSSSDRNDQFVIQPRPRQTTRKVSCGHMASSSRADEEAARIAEGRAGAAERDARASMIIQKVEGPLRPNYEYTLRRVDRQHPRKPTNFSLGENQYMVNCNENLFDWTTELHDHRFWNNFQADWYLTVIKDQKNPVTSQMYIDWAYMQ
jgi:hypothetical protein